MHGFPEELKRGIVPVLRRRCEINSPNDLHCFAQSQQMLKELFP